MSKFITGKAELQQSDIENKWYTMHNQLYKDYDETIYLVPRNYATDGYTIPPWLTWLGGSRMQWDIRPAIGHDFECEFHQELVVNLSEEELIKKGFVRTIQKHDRTITVCENIPIEYLTLRDTTFKSVNDKFKRMMIAVECIVNWRINLMRFAVNFNLGWLRSGKIKVDMDNLYSLYNKKEPSLR